MPRDFDEKLKEIIIERKSANCPVFQPIQFGQFRKKDLQNARV